MKIKAAFLALAALPWAGFAADISGTWKTEFNSQIGVQKYTYTLKQDGTNLTGKASSEIGDQKRETELKEGKVEGEKVSFVEMLKFQENEIRITYKGTISTNEMKLTREVGDFAKEEIVAKREAGRVAGAGPRGPGGRGGFGGPITLGPDDKAFFPNPPEGFDKDRKSVV